MNFMFEGHLFIS